LSKFHDISLDADAKWMIRVEEKGDLRMVYTEFRDIAADESSEAPLIDAMPTGSGLQLTAVTFVNCHAGVLLNDASSTPPMTIDDLVAIDSSGFARLLALPGRRSASLRNVVLRNCYLRHVAAVPYSSQSLLTLLPSNTVTIFNFTVEQTTPATIDRAADSYLYGWFTIVLVSNFLCVCLFVFALLHTAISIAPQGECHVSIEKLYLRGCSALEVVGTGRVVVNVTGNDWQLHSMRQVDRCVRIDTATHFDLIGLNATSNVASSIVSVSQLKKR
jgi:hypothetical protein